MTRKDEAREWIDEAPGELHAAGLNAGTAERAAMCVGLAQANATLALVEALLEIGEQLRVANLATLSTQFGLSNLPDGFYTPHVAAILGLKPLPRPIEDLGLEKRTYQGLRRAGILTDQELKTVIEDGTFLDIRNLGERALNECRRTLGIGDDQ